MGIAFPDDCEIVGKGLDVCHTACMAIDESQPEGGAAQRPALQVIEGGRALLERSALDAVFTDPDKLPDLLKQLSRPAVQLGLVQKDETGASRDPEAHGR